MKKEDIKAFEDACKVLGLDPEKVLPDFSAYPEKHKEAMTAHAKLVIIAEAINKADNDGDNWEPDWTDWNQNKYHPWFEMGSPSGVGFSYYVCGDWHSDSVVGSRLCFKTRDGAKYAGKQFEDLYKAYFVI